MLYRLEGDILNKVCRIVDYCLGKYIVKYFIFYSLFTEILHFKVVQGLSPHAVDNYNKQFVKKILYPMLDYGGTLMSYLMPIFSSYIICHPAKSTGHKVRCLP